MEWKEKLNEPTIKVEFKDKKIKETAVEAFKIFVEAEGEDIPKDYTMEHFVSDVFSQGIKSICIHLMKKEFKKLLGEDNE